MTGQSDVHGIAEDMGDVERGSSTIIVQDQSTLGDASGVQPPQTVPPEGVAEAVSMQAADGQPHGHDNTEGSDDVECGSPTLPTHDQAEVSDANGQPPATDPCSPAVADVVSPMPAAGGHPLVPENTAETGDVECGSSTLTTHDQAVVSDANSVQPMASGAPPVSPEGADGRVSPLQATGGQSPSNTTRQASVTNPGT